MINLILGIGVTILLLVLISIGVPVYSSFAAAALVITVALGSDLSYMVGGSLWQLGSFSLLALPLFVMAGFLMENSGVTRRLILWVKAITGSIKGSLGAVTVISTALFGAISGSNASAVATIGTIMIPQLEKEGYSRRYATALVACSAPIATLIPPSIAMILFSVTAGLPVIACFLSTVVPGILITSGYVLYNYLKVRKNPKIKVSEKTDTKTFLREVSKRSLDGLPALMMPVLVLGGIYSGLFTPTEAAAVAIAYTMLVGFFMYRKLTLRLFYSSLVRAGTVTASIMLMLFCIFCMGRGLMLGGYPELISDFVINASGGNKFMVILILNITLLLMGMFMDDCSGNVLAAILLLPLATKAGIHPIQFAAIAGTNLGLGNVTPPCAPLLLMAGGISGISLKEYFLHGMKLSLTVHLPVVFLTSYIPQISLFLPRLLLDNM